MTMPVPLYYFLLLLAAFDQFQNTGTDIFPQPVGLFSKISVSSVELIYRQAP